MSTKFPHLIKKGLVRIYKVRNRSYKDRTYSSFEIRYFNRSARLVREKKSSAPAALKRAKQIAKDILSGEPVVDMTAADRERWKTAVTNLLPTGVTTDVATAEYTQAHLILEGEISLVECARTWRAGHPKGQDRPSVTCAVEEFLRYKISRGVGARQQQSLRSRLRTFAKGFQCDLGTVTAAMVDQWIGSLEVKSNRTRNNYLGDIRNFFNWARKLRNYTQTDLSALSKAIVRKGRNQIWRPAEMRLLLETARRPYRDTRGHGRRKMRTDDELIPYLAIGAFAKLRSAELQRLDWAQIRWDQGAIIVRRNEAKTKVARQIQMQNNLKAWLKPYARLSGPILTVSAIHKRLSGLAERAGLKWRHNALRNSASTYHAIMTKDVKLVSREAGNSPAVLEAEYLEMEAASEAEAKEWFNIFPDDTGSVSQILHLPLFG